MFDLNLKLKNINPGTLADRVIASTTAMTGNAAFTTPDPPLAGLATKAAALKTKAAERDAAKAAAKALTKEVEDLAADLKNDYKELGSYVGKTATTEAQVTSAAMEVKAKAAPKAVPDRIEGLDVTPSNEENALDAQWDPDEDADMYDVETNDDPDNAATWKHVCACTNSRETIKNLTSGARVWVRVRGRNAAGPGAWSDPAVRRVP